MRENVGILPTKRSHSNYNVPKVSAKKNYFFPEIMDLQSFLKICYLRKKALILDETFGTL
jgi:hypothetical protein